MLFMCREKPFIVRGWNGDCLLRTTLHVVSPHRVISVKDDYRVAMRSHPSLGIER